MKQLTTGAAALTSFANVPLPLYNPSMAQTDWHFTNSLIFVITAEELDCPTSAALIIAVTAGCKVPVAKFL
jgi:hypothetical protein